MNAIFKDTFLKTITQYNLLILLIAIFAFSPSYAAETPAENSSEKIESIENKSKQAEPTTASSLWGDFKEAASDASEKVSTLSSELADGGIDGYDIAAQYSEAVFNEFVEGVEKNIAALEKMGFVVTDLYVSVGLIPAISLKITKVADVPLEKQQAILKESGNSAVLSYALKKLNQAYSMEIGVYQIKAVRMDLSLPPKTSVHFVKVAG